MVCSSPTCTSIERRCGRPFESCEGTGAQVGFCDDGIFECPDQGAVGQVTPEQVAADITPITEIPPGLIVPADEQLPLQDFLQEVPDDFCTVEQEPVPEDVKADEATVCGGTYGSDKWGFYYDCVADYDSALSFKQLLGESEYDVNVSVGYGAGANIYGSQLEALRVSASVGLSHCGAGVGGEVKVFGDAIAMLDHALRLGSSVAPSLLFWSDVEGQPRTGAGIDLKLELELYGFVPGLLFADEQNDDVGGYAHGEWSLGVWVGGGYRDVFGSDVWTSWLGFSGRWPAVAGVLCCWLPGND